MKPRAIVVGSGAGGATAARELQGAFDVTVLEAGGSFRPLSFNLRTIERLKRSRLVFDPRLIRVPFPATHARRTREGMVLVHGSCVGGTTTIATGNGLRVDDDLRALGLDLDEEFDEIAREIPVSTAHRRGWHATTRRLFDVFDDLGLDPMPMPKMGDPERCRHCGRCVLGCPEGAKWDARRFVDDAVHLGARVITRSRVDRLVIEYGATAGVIAREGLRRRFHPADLVVLAAGGLGTPPILERSGIPCDPTLFVDPVLTVAGRRSRAWQCKEIEMPFVAQRDGYILSPYFDYLSFLLEPTWQAPARDLVGVMIKIADSNAGTVSPSGVEKNLSARDRVRIEQGAELGREILLRFGIEDGKTFSGTLNAGHPGGTVPLTQADVRTMHPWRLPENVYIADASLLPRALGNPPILTIVALAKRVAKVCAEQVRAPLGRPSVPSSGPRSEPGSPSPAETPPRNRRRENASVGSRTIPKVPAQRGGLLENGEPAEFPRGLTHQRVASRSVRTRDLAEIDVVPDRPAAPHVPRGGRAVRPRTITRNSTEKPVVQ